MKETKTEPTLSTPRPAAKPTNENKTPKVEVQKTGITDGGAGQNKLEAQPQVAGAGEVGKADGIPAPQGHVQGDKPESKPTLKDFDAFLKAAPKEWLPTLMVRIANKCMAEKVFASPGAMAEAIVGASKK